MFKLERCYIHSYLLIGFLTTVVAREFSSNNKVISQEFPLSQFLGLNPNTKIKDISKRSYLCSMDSRSRCCSCEKDCPKFGSCCIDKFWTSFQQNSSLIATVHERNMLEMYLDYFFEKIQQDKEDYECTELVPLSLRQKIATKHSKVSPTMSYYMVTKCKKSIRSEHRMDVPLCEQPNTDKYLNFVPVQDEDGKIYRNSACARCNGARDYQALPIEAQCGYTHNISLSALSACEFALTNKHKNVKCVKQTYMDAQCSNKLLKKKCSLYQGILGGYERPTYRNYHCYKCIMGEQNDSVKISNLRTGCGSSGQPVYWSMLIEYSQKFIFKRDYDGKILKIENKCSSDNQIFDIFSNQCYNKSGLQHFEFGKNSSRLLMNSTNVTRTTGKESTAERAKQYTQYHLANLYIFITGSTLSIICYSVTLFTYGYFEELQNVHGYNILGMCVSLLAADALMLLANATSCYVIGVMLHYVILVAQVWVVIICFDIAVSFHSKLCSIKNKKVNNKTKLFGKYISVALMGPLLVVIPALALSKVGSGYVNSCKPDGLSARLLLYVLPIAGLNLLSLCVLIKTFLKIHRDKQETRKMLQSSQTQTDVFRMACKLMVGLGVIECIGFVQVNEGTSIFDQVSSVVYNIVRSFRGVFVCIVFVLNDRVMKLYRKRFVGSFQIIGSVSKAPNE